MIKIWVMTTRLDMILDLNVLATVQLGSPQAATLHGHLADKHTDVLTLGSFSK